MTALLQWYQLRHLDYSITVYCHNMSVSLITCHQHSHNCFIRMLSINMACSIHMSSTVITVLLQCYQYTRLLYYSILPKYFSPLILTTAVSENLSNFLELTLSVLKSLMVVTDYIYICMYIYIM